MIHQKWSRHSKNPVFQNLDLLFPLHPHLDSDLDYEPFCARGPFPDYPWRCDFFLVDSHCCRKNCGGRMTFVLTIDLRFAFFCYHFVVCSLSYLYYVKTSLKMKTRMNGVFFENETFVIKVRLQMEPFV